MTLDVVGQPEGGEVREGGEGRGGGRRREGNDFHVPLGLHW